MRYSESFSMEDDDDLAMKLQEIEKTAGCCGLLWKTGNGGYSCFRRQPGLL